MSQRRKPIRILRGVMLLVSFLCIVVFVPWSGVRAWLSPLPDSVETQVERASDYGLDGIIVYVDEAGQQPELFAAGWKNRAAGEPADASSLFKIASISKLYLAVATAKAVHQNLLSLDDSLGDLLPDVSDQIANSDRITLRMLVRHRSGIPDFVRQTDFRWEERQSDINDNLKLVFNLEPDFEPGAKYEYSNTNYLLLSKILDRALQEEHWAFVEREILDPLGLDNTYFNIEQAPVDKIVSGYHYDSDDDLKNLVYMTPGGAVISTAEDVGIFLRALNDGTLLSPDEDSIYSAIYEYGHTGWLRGYQSVARYHEDLDAVVIQFVSSTGGTSEMVSRIVYRRILRILERNQKS